MSDELTACRYLIRGRVQGVGYRYFAQKVAAAQNVSGYARNLEDGSAEPTAYTSTDPSSRFRAYPDTF